MRSPSLVLAGAALLGATGYVIQEPGGDQEGVGVPGVNARARRTDRKPSIPESAVRAYGEAVRRTAGMTNDQEAQALAARRDLRVLNITWEDTGRYKGSSVGPNISDMTIQVQHGGRAYCMPVIRYDNFTDKTADLDPRDFTLLVGNHRGQGLRRVSLQQFLANPTAYLTKPDSWRWKGRSRSLLAERDSKVLVSAQACFLPVPQQGIATFNPVLFNYQSVSGDPAVLTILATREGTSVTVIDNKRDAFSEGGVWGQRLFHNENGERASLTGQRLTDFKASDRTGAAAKGGSNLSMVLLIQVPLKQQRPRNSMMGGFGGGGFGGPGGAPAAAESKAMRASNVEAAVIGHGDLEGPFTEIDNLPIERDPRFPVRVTVQFYKATSNGVVSPGDIGTIANEIESVYKASDSVGSLVVGGETGRVTEYDGVKVQPIGWWREFWRRHQENTGDDRDTAIRKLRQLLGNDYESRPVSELYLRDLLRS